VKGSELRTLDLELSAHEERLSLGFVVDELGEKFVVENEGDFEKS
jgi:hypothetical protein